MFVLARPSKIPVSLSETGTSSSDDSKVEGGTLGLSDVAIEIGFSICILLNWGAGDGSKTLSVVR